MNSDTSAFQCAICGPLVFSNKWNYESHLKTRRHILKAGLPPDVNAANRFSCTHCGHDFSRKDSLERHVREIHSKSGSSLPACDVCSKVFSNKSNLIRHLNLHRRENPPPSLQVETNSLRTHSEAAVGEPDVDSIPIQSGANRAGSASPQSG